MRNDLVLWPTDTNAGFDHFKVMISRVLKDRPYIDDAKKISEILHTFAISNMIANVRINGSFHNYKDFKFCGRRVYKIRVFENVR